MANKDLILREKLAIQRTMMSNQTTLLAFMRTAMYFLVAGLSLPNLLQIENSLWLEIGFYATSGLIFAMGLFNYSHQKRKIKQSEKHIGDFKLEYLDEI